MLKIQEYLKYARKLMVHFLVGSKESNDMRLNLNFSVNVM